MKKLRKIFWKQENHLNSQSTEIVHDFGRFISFKDYFCFYESCECECVWNLHNVALHPPIAIRVEYFTLALPFAFEVEKKFQEQSCDNWREKTSILNQFW